MALEMAEVGEQLVRSRLSREHPDWGADEVEGAVLRWRHDRPGAPHGDHPGPPSTRFLPRPPR